jgi:hypothetical protein
VWNDPDDTGRGTSIAESSAFASINDQHYESFGQELEVSRQHYGTNTDVSSLGPWCDTSFDVLVDMHAELLHTLEPTLETKTAVPDTLHRLAVAFAVWRKQVIQLRGEQARRMAQILQDVSDLVIPASQRALISLRQWLDSAPQDHRFWQGAICLLVELAVRSGELPGSLFKDGMHIGNLHIAEAVGGLADVFRGTLEGQVVAVKNSRRVPRDAAHPVSQHMPPLLHYEPDCMTASVSGITHLASADSSLHPPIHWYRQPNIPER